MRVLCRMICAALLLGSSAVAAPADMSPEQRAAAAMARATTTPQLRLFLQAMPKGGDLHNHPAGAPFAEDLIDWAAGAGMCVSTVTNRLSPGPCGAEQVEVRGLATRDYPRYSRLVDTLSVRGYEQGLGDPLIPGFDRFFFAIDSSGAPRDPAKSFAAAREAAAFDNVQYAEFMTGGGEGQAIVTDAAASSGLDGTDFDAMASLLAPLLPAAVAKARSEYDGYEDDGRTILGCATSKPSPACAVETRYMNVGFRTRPPAIVFAGLAFSFALAQADPRFVGVNLVGPEHDPVARRDYDLHMRMIAYLHGVYPNVPIALHAGELALGVVPPRDLRSHIAQAVEVAGARRIGHGIDIAMEYQARAVLERMAHDRIAVEANLTSNAVILGVKGRDHPLKLYLARGVPVVLGTDDSGLTRGDMTNEFVRAVQEQQLTYPVLKQIVRNSLEYSFLPGSSLFKAGKIAASCKDLKAIPEPACSVLLAGSQRARQQYELERRFVAFEAAQH